jgi:hypothetical protein
MDESKDIHFPKCGIDLSGPFSMQQPRPGYQGVYARTTHKGMNVRGFDSQGKWRGGSRAGLSKHIATMVGGNTSIVQHLEAITGATYVGDGSVQTSQAGRVVTLVAVSQGNVYRAHAGDTVWTAATNSTGSTPPLNYTGVVFSAANRQTLWFADGVNWCAYRVNSNTVERWTALAGTLPVDSDGNAPRLIETWRGRLVLSGLLGDPQNWFMSAVDGPRDYDYGGGESQEPTDAVAGSSSPLGLIGDIITGIVPYNDNIAYFGGDHTLWVMNGDPMDGGSLLNVSNVVGMAWGRAWCIDPFGTIYFMSNNMRVYAMSPGSTPKRISYGIDPLLEDLNPGTHSVRLLWNERSGSVHVFITPLAAAASTNHYVFEQRSGAWWEDHFANEDMDPIAACVFDGNEPTDRTLLLGSWDGYVRAVDDDAVDDDGEDIASEVWIGPFVTPTFDDMMLLEAQAVLDEASGDVDFAIYTGSTAQEAMESEAFHEGTWEAGRNLTSFIRAADHASFIKITSTNQWAMESIRLRLGTRGPIRQRGK